jgi:hypothetical protein
MGLDKALWATHRSYPSNAMSMAKTSSRERQKNRLGPYAQHQLHLSFLDHIMCWYDLLRHRTRHSYRCQIRPRSKEIITNSVLSNKGCMDIRHDMNLDEFRVGVHDVTDADVGGHGDVIDLLPDTGAFGFSHADRFLLGDMTVSEGGVTVLFEGHVPRYRVPPL